MGGHMWTVSYKAWERSKP